MELILFPKKFSELTQQKQYGVEKWHKSLLWCSQRTSCDSAGVWNKSLRSEKCGQRGYCTSTPSVSSRPEKKDTNMAMHQAPPLWKLQFKPPTPFVIFNASFCWKHLKSGRLSDVIQMVKFKRGQGEKIAWVDVKVAYIFLLSATRVKVFR